MPWSPVKKFPIIIENIRRSGRFTISTANLEVEIIKEIGVIRQETITNMIKTMEKLGYIKSKEMSDGSFLWTLNVKEQEKIETKKDEQQLNDIIESLPEGERDNENTC